MAKFRKIPVVIDAVQFHGMVDGVVGDPELMELIDSQDLTVTLGPSILAIDTLEGQMVASVGDWIIKGVKGELYPCKPDIFAMTYEAV